MKYALVNGIKQQASKGLQGKCLCCGADVIAKCGSVRVYHWAHKNKNECTYSQKEAKKQWHIVWQNCFPDWQEVECFNEQTGEIRIADVKTPYGFVVEFQHSHIAPGTRVRSQIPLKRKQRVCKTLYYPFLISANQCPYTMVTSIAINKCEIFLCKTLNLHEKAYILLVQNCRSASNDLLHNISDCSNC